MSDIRRLYQLQLLDQEIVARTAEHQELQERLAGWPELNAARERLKEARSSVALVEREQRDNQAEVDAVVPKLGREEQRLYSGEVKNPRELTGLQQEVWALQAQRSEREERLLEVLIRLDEARAMLRREEGQAREMEAQWASMQQQMQSEAAALSATLERLSAQREQAITGVDASSFRLYESLRVARNGQAVARVEQNRCQGCRVELPAAVLQRVRQDRDLTQCNHCNRLLHVM